MSNTVKVFSTVLFQDPEDAPGQLTLQSGSEGPFDASTLEGRESIEYVCNHRFGQMQTPDPEGPYANVWQYVQIVRVEEHATTSPVLNT